ncbi:MAG: (Fe-S)-binding protein [Anaerolineae bacterium]
MERLREDPSPATFEGLRVSLFVTCLTDLFYPEIGEGVVQVLRRLGIKVDFPSQQTCCGQPAFNSGYRQEAAQLARRFITIFEGADYVVAPSGSCTHMVRHEYPRLLADDPAMHARARALSGKVYEFTEFLVKVLGVSDVGAVYHRLVTYHDSCHLRRGLGVVQEPRALLRAVKGLELVEMAKSDRCCGFGGSFAVRFPEISQAILEEKVERVLATGADILVAADAGCLMHIGGALQRKGRQVETMHVAQLLARGEG